MCFGQTNWTQKNDNVNDVSFINANTGYVCKDHTIEKTTDRGNSWILIYTFADTNLLKCIVASDSIICVSAKTKVYYKIVIAANWKVNSQFVNLAKIGIGNRNIYALDYNNGGLLQIWKSVNLDTIWTNLYNQNSSTNFDLNVFGDSLYYVGTSAPLTSVVYKNANSIWSVTNGNALQINFLDSFNNGFLLTKEADLYCIYNFKNMNNSWIERNYKIYGISFMDTSKGYYSSDSGTYRTTSGLQHFTLNSNQTFKKLYSKNNITFGITTLYKRLFVDSVLIPTSINPNINTISKDYKLFTNYPNPFNSTTIIKYSVSIKSNVSIKLYDISGKYLQTIVNNKSQNPGAYEVQVNMSNLSSGIYLCKYNESVIKLTLMK